MGLRRQSATATQQVAAPDLPQLRSFLTPLWAPDELGRYVAARFKQNPVTLFAVTSSVLRFHFRSLRIIPFVTTSR